MLHRAQHLYCHVLYKTVKSDLKSGGRFNVRNYLNSIGISVSKIRQCYGHFAFIMGIPIPQILSKYRNEALNECYKHTRFWEILGEWFQVPCTTPCIPQWGILLVNYHETNLQKHRIMIWIIAWMQYCDTLVSSQTRTSHFKVQYTQVTNMLGERLKVYW